VIALAAYLPLLAAAAVVVWRRPVAALYLFVVGLALHNAVMAALFSWGVDGAALTAIQAWKELLLAVALARVAWDAVSSRSLPFAPGAVDLLAVGFGAVVVVYALVPQTLLDGDAGAEAILLGVRHSLLPVGAYLLGRSLALSRDDLARLAWTVLGTAAAVAAIGLVEMYTVDVERWRAWGVPGYFREELGFDYHGPGGMPENFAFNSDEGLFRRLISTFLSPLATAFLLAVALLLAAAGAPFRRRPAAAVALAAVAAVGLLFTLSRSTLLALAGGLVVLALARGRWWPLAAAGATVGVAVVFALSVSELAPTTHFFPDELEYQRQLAEERGDVAPGETILDPRESSLRSHLDSLRDGARTVVEHPQGYGPGNAGAVAQRGGVEPKAGESNYTELGVEVGAPGLALFVGWSLLVLLELLRRARRDDERAAAGLAAAFACVLALGLQTDAYGVPWLAYCLWAAAGGVIRPTPLELTRASDGRVREDEPVSGRIADERPL
jgi:hypothetical protein